MFDAAAAKSPVMHKLWLPLGAFAGLAAVAMSALLAHALPQRLDPARLQMVAGAVQMQGWHALALVLTGVWAARGGVLATMAGCCFAAGTLLFCGGVYAIALAGVRLGPAAPSGGVLLMLGWLLLGCSAFRAV